MTPSTNGKWHSYFHLSMNGKQIIVIGCRDGMECTCLHFLRPSQGGLYPQPKPMLVLGSTSIKISKFWEHAYKKVSQVLFQEHPLAFFPRL